MSHKKGEEGWAMSYVLLEGRPLPTPLSSAYEEEG